MHQDTVVRFRQKDEVIDPLAELLRRGAKKLIEQAVSEEFELFLERHAERRDSEGRQAVVKNGYLPRREVLSGIGCVPVTMPRARDRSGEGLRLSRSIRNSPLRTIEISPPSLTTEVEGGEGI